MSGGTYGLCIALLKTIENLPMFLIIGAKKSARDLQLHCILSLEEERRTSHQDVQHHKDVNRLETDLMGKLMRTERGTWTPKKLEQVKALKDV